MSNYPTNFPTDAQITEIPKGGTLFVGPDKNSVYIMFWYQRLHIESAGVLTGSGLSEWTGEIWTNTYLLTEQQLNDIPGGYGVREVQTLLGLNANAQETPTTAFGKMLFFDNQSAVANLVYHHTSPSRQPPLKALIVNADNEFRAARQAAFPNP